MTELPERPWQNISLDFSGPYPSGEYLVNKPLPAAGKPERGLFIL